MEAASDLIEGDLLSKGAVVPDVDVEGVRVAFDKSVVDRCRCGRQGEQRSEKPALSVHVGCNDCGSVEEV